MLYCECLLRTELQKRANPANQLVLFFLAGANFLGKSRENRRKTGAFLVLIFLGEKLVGANFYAFCNYGFGAHVPELWCPFEMAYRFFVSTNMGFRNRSLSFFSHLFRHS